jgi:hypothetical protein
MRIHDKVPTLKTLFTIKTPKPGSDAWGSPQGAQMSEGTVINVLFHDLYMAHQLFDDDVWPQYVLQAYMDVEDVSFVTLSSRDGEAVPAADILINPQFTGVRFTVELDPRYDRATTLRDLYARLKEIADTYAEAEEIEVDFDEKYCWLGGHFNGLRPVIQKANHRG